MAFWITIHRPDKRNALNAEVVAGIREGLRAAHADPDVRAIVLTGSGTRAFCAGGDLQPGQGFAFDLSKPNVDYADLLREAQAATLPTIARVNGACMAGGMGLLCMTDLAVAADDVLFGLPEVKVGVFPMQVMSLLQELRETRGITIVLITHEPDIAAYGTRIIAVRDGLITSDKPNVPRKAYEEAEVIPMAAAGGR